jgi:MFS transporter, CP family, cyanate transporter
VKRPRAVLLVGLLAGTLAVRPQLTAVGPLLPEIQDDFGIDHATAGLLVTVPVLCMGLFALPVARLLRRTDVRTATGWCLAAIAIATILRPLSPGFSAMVGLTFVFGVGSGVVGALLPVVVKERFAERPALGTGVFALGLNVGATLGAGLAVPLALATDGWRWSLGLLALAGALAVPAWVRLSRDSLGHALPVETVDHLPWRSGFAWSATLVFGLQALCFFGLNAWLADALIEGGWREGSAGALLALLNLIAIPGVLLVSLLCGRVIGVRPYLALAAGGLVTGTVGLASTVGDGTAWGWVAVIGLSLGSLFALAMTLSVAATGSPGEASALASMQLGVGYTMAAVAPFALGSLRDATGSFAAGLWVVAAIAVLVAVFVAATIVQLGRRAPAPAQA